MNACSVYDVFLGAACVCIVGQPTIKLKISFVTILLCISYRSVNLIFHVFILCAQILRFFLYISIFCIDPIRDQAWFMQSLFICVTFTYLILPIFASIPPLSMSYQQINCFHSSSIMLSIDFLFFTLFIQYSSFSLFVLIQSMVFVCIVCHMSPLRIILNQIINVQPCL